MPNGPAPLFIAGAVEGPVDEAVLRRIVAAGGATLYPVYGGSGKASLQRGLPGYNQAAERAPWVVLVDLDRDAPCAPSFVGSWLPRPARLMCFRVAVRAVEAWLIADRDRLASFLGVSSTRVPTDPDALADPKQALVNLARKSRRRAVKADLVPRPGSGRRVGPGYASRLLEFVEDFESGWRLEVAERQSTSLSSASRRIAELARSAGSPSPGPSSIDSD